MYKPLDMFLSQTDELKKLIAEYPDYPVVVVVSDEVVADDGSCWWYAPTLKFTTGELLDCEQKVTGDGRIFSDRQDFSEAVEYALEDEYNTDEEFNRAVADTLAEYEPYWKKVIMIYADI